jgi:hypothetical protein
MASFEQPQAQAAANKQPLPPLPEIKLPSFSVADVPLKLSQPFNIIVFVSFLSPIILAMIMVSLSFIFQNFKGLIYLGFLLGVCTIRNYVYYLYKASPTVYDNSICTSIEYSKYGNSTFSTFVYAFTSTYLMLPMFINNTLNLWVFCGLIFAFCLDIFLKFYKKCKIDIGDILINALLGVATASMIVTAMYSGGSNKFMFYNEIASNKESCSVAKNQTFKCSVYKNGELIGDV